MLFVGDARGEVDSGGVAASGAVADLQAPEPIDLDGLTVRVLERAEEIAGCRIEGVDLAIAEIAYQQTAGQAAEVAGREGQSPRRVEGLAGNQTMSPGAIWVEYINESMPGTS